MCSGFKEIETVFEYKMNVENKKKLFLEIVSGRGSINNSSGARRWRGRAPLFFVELVNRQIPVFRV